MHRNPGTIWRLLALELCCGLILACAWAAAEPVIEEGIVYKTVDGRALTLDFLRPEGDGPFPLVMCIHGGGWQMGNKTGHHKTLNELAEHGYAGATVSYRFADRHPFPAQLEDVQCALAYLKAHAEELQIDPQRIAVLGDSAGGHLSLMLGLGEAQTTPECLHPAEDLRVQAIVNFYGPTDFPRWDVDDQTKENFAKGFGKSFDTMLADLVGTADPADDRMKNVSPITHVDATDPPVLTLHGTEDKLVPPAQAEYLHEALRNAGVREQLVLVENAGHGWGGEQREYTYQKVVEFLGVHLGKKP